MRPIYDQIKAQMTARCLVAALALLVQRLLDLFAGLLEGGDGMDFSAEAGDGGAPDGTLGDVSHGGSTGTSRGQWRLPGQPPRVLKALKLTDLKPPTPPAGEETVM